MMSLSNKLVLLIEDDTINAIVYTSFMEEWGLVVRRVRNGVEALRVVHEGVKFDLILMDIQMPIMNGIQTTIELRRAGDKTPIIVVTGGSLDEDIAKALSAGANDYAIKPVSESQLFHVVTKWLPM